MNQNQTFSVENSKNPRLYIYHLFFFLKAVIAALRSTNVTEDQLLRAKKSLQVSLQSQASGPMLETLGSSILFGSKEGLTPGQVVAACNNVTLSDVMVRFTHLHLENKNSIYFYSNRNYSF